MYLPQIVDIWVTIMSLLRRPSNGLFEKSSNTVMNEYHNECELRSSFVCTVAYLCVCIIDEFLGINRD